MINVHYFLSRIKLGIDINNVNCNIYNEVDLQYFENNSKQRKIISKL